MKFNLIEFIFNVLMMLTYLKLVAYIVGGLLRIELLLEKFGN